MLIAFIAHVRRYVTVLRESYRRISLLCRVKDGVFFIFFLLGDRRLEIRVDGVRPVFPVGVHVGLHRGHVRDHFPGAVAVRSTAAHRFPAVVHTPAPEQLGAAARNRLLRAHLRLRLSVAVVALPWRSQGTL